MLNTNPFFKLFYYITLQFKLQKKILFNIIVYIDNIWILIIVEFNDDNVHWIKAFIFNNFRLYIILFSYILFAIYQLSYVKNWNIETLKTCNIFTLCIHVYSICVIVWH